MKIEPTKAPLKNIVLRIACLLFLAFAAIGAGDAATLKVAFYELDGFFERGHEGAESGYGVELLERISEYSGVRFEYVPASSWERTKEMLLSGEADIRMPGTLPTSPNSRLGYTGESVLSTYHALMSLKSRGDLYYKDYGHFSALKIAISGSLYNNTAIHKYLDGIGVTGKNLVFYDEYLRCREALDSGEADALISNIMDMDGDMKVLARFNSVSNHISMRAGDPNLKKLDAALNEIKMDDPSFLPLLYQKYYPERTVTPFTREEAEFVLNSGTITIGQLPGRKTFAYRDEATGKTSGIFIDLCELIAKKKRTQI